MKVNPNEKCSTCDHRRGVHRAMQNECMRGNHPDRDRPDFEQYRAEYDACDCTQMTQKALDTDALDQMTDGNPYGH